MQRPFTVVTMHAPNGCATSPTLPAERHIAGGLTSRYQRQDKLILCEVPVAGRCTGAINNVTSRRGTLALVDADKADICCPRIENDIGRASGVVKART